MLRGIGALAALVVLLFFPSLAHGGTTAGDCAVLEEWCQAADVCDLNVSLFGDPTWCCPAPPAQPIPGVACSDPALPPRIEKINARDIGLSGGCLPDSLGKLTSLTSLDLAAIPSSNFTGPIDAVSNLTQLAVLYLSRNSFNGTIGAVSNLTQLVKLELNGNSFTGTIDAVSNLTQLTVLDLYDNLFSGPIDAVSNLTQLVKLDLYDNSFSGPIDVVSNLTQLTVLDLYENSFSGPIDVVSNLTQLTVLKLNDNSFSGPIDAVSSLVQLTVLKLNDNSFSGPIDAVSNLTQLKTLFLHNNSFSGPIDAVSNLTQLAVLDLYDNSFSGPIDVVSNLTQLAVLELYENSFTGPIDAVSSLIQLTVLKLNDNSFSGPIDAVSSLVQLTVLTLHDNSFNGFLPDLASLAALAQLDLHNNDLNISLGTWRFPPVLTDVNLSGNILQGSEHTVSFPSVVRLNLSHAGMTGLIVSVALNCSASVLDVSRNDLNCPFPLLPSKSAVTILVGSCKPRWRTVVAVGLTGCVVAGIVVVTYLALRGVFREQDAMLRNSLKFKSFSALVVWGFGVADLTLDVNLGLDILAYIEQDSCAAVTDWGFSRAILPPSLKYFPLHVSHPDFSLFADYITWLKEDGWDTEVSSTVEYIEDFCDDLHACSFSRQGNVCQRAPVEDTLLSLSEFRVAVVAFLAVYAAKEFTKLLGLLLLSCRLGCPFYRRFSRLADSGGSLSSLDLRVGYLCSKSVFAPLFAPLLGVQVYAVVLLHEASLLDSALEIFYESLENVPNLLVGAYYVSSVTHQGLSPLNMASIGLTAAATLWLLVKTMVLAHKLRKRRRKERNPSLLLNGKLSSLHDSRGSLKLRARGDSSSLEYLHDGQALC